MSAKMRVTAQKLKQNANKTKKEEQKLREKLQTLFKENNDTTKQQFKPACSNSNSSKTNVQKQKVKLNAQAKTQKTNPIKTQKQVKSAEIAKKPNLSKNPEQQKAKTTASKQENQTKQKQAKSNQQTMKPNLNSDKKNATIKRTATPKMVQPVKKKKQQDCEKLQFYDDSSSDNEYYLNPEEEARANIVDEYLENEMNYDDCSEEEMEEEEQEEEEQNYSDFDEDDYEEENDSYLYSDDDDSSYDDSESVFSYEHDLEAAPDDLIIHKGTATKRALEAKDGKVNFDSDHEGVQIVELQQSEVKVIKQRSEYDRDVLLKLSKVERDFTLKLNVSEGNESDCPQLVPIVQDENDQDVPDEEMEIYEEEDDESMSDDSCADYEECDSDDWSYTSESISAKYEATDSNKKCNMPVKMQAHVIKAVGSVSSNNNENINTANKILDETDLTASAIMERTMKTSQNKAVIITKPVYEHSQEDDVYEACSSASQSPKNHLNNNASLLDTSNNNNSNIDQSLCEKNVLDNTENCSQIEFEEQQSEVQVPKPTAMKTRIFTPALSTRFVLAVLKDPIYFYGTIRFKVLAGALEVYGFQPLLNKEYELFSPRGCSAVNLVPMQSNTPTDLAALRMQLHAEFDEDTWKIITRIYDAQNDAIVMLLRNDERARLITHFRRYMNENVFPNIRTDSSDKALPAAEQLLNCYINKSSTQALQIPSEWQQLPLLTDMRLLLAGGKSVGKSTLLRYLVNRLLSTNATARENGVLLVDLDIGQPELCAPEMVSCTLLRQPLLGPGFFLNQPADCAYLVGQVNVTLCAQRYLRAVQMLIEHCKNNKAYEGVPWIINTMGYNQGIGLELIAAICDMLKPSHVVQIQSNERINNFTELLEPSVLRSMEQQLMGLSLPHIDKPLEKYAVNDFSLKGIPAAVQQLSRYQREWSMSAKDMRFAILISQMSDILLDQSINVCERPPYCAALTDIKVRSLNEPHRTSFELQQALTANIVYLCRQDTTADETQPMKCFGIAVVRSIDEKQIYITPAAAIESMQVVNCLVLSEQPLPTSNLKQQGVRNEETYLPFLYATKANASTAVKHIYHRPAEFQTGKHRELVA